MAFGHKSQPSKQYVYGARSPDDADALRQQLWLAAKYKNALVEQELSKRKKYRELLDKNCFGMNELKEQRSGFDTRRSVLRKIIKDKNSKDRKRTIDPAIKQEIENLSKLIKDLDVEIKAKKVEGKEDKNFLAAVELLNQENEEAKRVLYNKFGDEGLFWGTRLIVRETVKGSGNDPKFKRFDGTGTLAIQIQKSNSLSVADLMDGKQDRRVMLVRTDNPKYYELKCRIIGEGKDEDFVYTTIPIKLHREMPPDAQIKWIKLMCYRTGTHLKWKASFILSKDTWESQPCGEHEAALDVGWRMTEKGLRVATWYGSDGQQGDIVIPHNRIDRWKKIQDLQSIRSNLYNDRLASFRTWLKADHGLTIPEIILDRLKTISHWQGSSQSRLASVVSLWRNNRFEGDSGIFDSLEIWRKQDKHLYDWQEAQRQSIILWRKHHYQQEILNLKKTYGTLVVEAVNWSKLQKNKQPEEVDPISRTNRAIAAVGLLRDMIDEAVNMVMVESEYSSRECSQCHQICTLDGSQFHTCEHCSAVWDRDLNAAMNLLNRTSRVVEKPKKRKIAV